MLDVCAITGFPANVKHFKKWTEHNNNNNNNNNHFFITLSVQ